jgi:hypothetical protein
LLLALFARKEFAPEVMTQLGHGGFLMLEYQKSSAAAPKTRHCFERNVSGVCVCFDWR